MDIRAEINSSLKTAMKNKDGIAVATVRLILAALKDRDITLREQGNSDGLDDDGVFLMLKSMIKQRNESSKTYSEAGRFDLAEREEAEIDLIKAFLPKQLDEEEVAKIIDDIAEKVGAKDIRDMGKLMGVLKSEYGTRIDMSKVGVMVKEKLS